MERIFSHQFHAAEGAEAWRVLPEGAYSFFRSESFAASVRFVEAIAGLVDDGEAPNIDIRSDGVTVLIRAFKGGHFGLVQRDLDLARSIATTADEMGLTAEPSAIQSLSIIPGATDRKAIMPFWRRVLGYVPRPDSPDEDLVDSHDRGVPFWFEEMEELRADGAGTIHLVVWVPWDEAASRVEAGIAAGGRLVRHNVEEGFWTLADPAGNEVDIATTSAPGGAESEPSQPAPEGSEAAGEP
ncbi:MAG TPA: VOC family protein [Candidatus Limnocylindria bacterium]|nr:VOC family protein [Candidatus Limnocylindria bacterium]